MVSLFGNIRVLELGRVFSGPLCGMILADLGARVLKVEQPGVGDESRGFGVHSAGGNSCYFNSLNRNKKSIALDLKGQDDRDLFAELIGKADVLVHNWVQASLDKLGFSYARVKVINPRIIYCGISGYGAGTDFAHKPAQDIVAQALSGFMSLTGDPDGHPLKTGIPVVDYATGLYAGFSIMSALYMRQATGEGQFVSVSLLETALAMTSFASSTYLSAGVTPSRTGNRHPSICPYNLYQTRDGHVVVAVANDAMWARLCCAVGLEALIYDDRFSTNPVRLLNQDELEPILGGEIGRFDTAEIVSLLEAAKVSCAQCNTLPQAFDCEPIAQLGMKMSWADAPDISVVGKPFHLEKNPEVPTSPPPSLGSDATDIRAARDW